MNVGNGVAVGELQRGVLLEERHHPRAGFQESVDHRRIKALAQFVFQVSARQFNVFDDACASGQRVARHPGPATGPGRGTAEHRVLFYHYDFQSMPRGGHGRRQSRRTGTNDQHIAVDVGKKVRLGRHCLNSGVLLFWNLVPENIRIR
ncbi:hypothetical protein D9M71_456540 [compost metagenome]